jgi:hypothetical protein
MVKKHTNLSIEHELVEKAKERGFSISEITEEALRDKLGKTQVEIDREICNCEFCGIELPKQTAKDLTKGLCWLWPDEKWICPRCLRKKIRSVNIGGGIHQ